MELFQLRQFEKIAEYENMTKAAEELHISQPTLSSTVRSLERELGVRLFSREKKRLHLTEADKILSRHAEQILGAERSALDEIERFKRHEAEIEVGFCDPGPMWYYAPRYTLQNTDKKMSPELFSLDENPEKLLRDHRYHVLITAGPVTGDGIESVPLVHEYFTLSLPREHPLASKHALCFRDAGIRKALLLYVEGSAFLDHQKVYWKELGDKVSLELCSDYFLFLQRLQSSDIVSFSTFLSQTYREHLPSRVLVPLTDPELSIDYYVTYLSADRQNLRSFLEWIKRA